MVTWAKGSKALFICERCGFTIKYRDRLKEESGLFVCTDCYDGAYQKTNHPQLFIKAPPPDGVLKDPMPDAVAEVPEQLSVGNRLR